MIKRIAAVVFFLAAVSLCFAFQGMGPGPGVKSYSGGGGGTTVCVGNFSSDCAETSYPTGDKWEVLNEQVTVVDTYTATENGTANRIRAYFGLDTSNIDPTYPLLAVFYVNDIKQATANMSTVADSSWTWSDGDLNASFSSGDVLSFGVTFGNATGTPDVELPRQSGGSTFKYSNSTNGSAYNMTDISGISSSGYMYGFILEYTN